MGKSTGFGKENLLSFRMILLFLFLVGCLSLFGQDHPENEEKEKEKKENAADSTKTKEKTFRDFIPDTARSMKGMLTVHQVKNKYFFELPDSIFGRDIMTVTRIAKTPTGAGYGGEQANRQVIRFEKGPDKKIFIRVVTFVNARPDTSHTIHAAVNNSNMHPIVAAFDIKAIRKDTSVLIEVGDFFQDPNQAFDLPPATKQRYKIKSLAKDRSFIQHIHTY